MPVRSLKKREAVRSAIQRIAHLRDAERGLIDGLLADRNQERLADAEYVIQQIRDIIRNLSSVTAGAGRRLLMAVRLGPDVELSRVVEAASNREAPAMEPLLQRSWIENDLRGDIRIVARVAPYPHFVLRGARLEYRVKEWAVAGLSTWDIGFCHSVEVAPRGVADDQYYSLGQRKLEIQTYPNVRRTMQALRDRSAAWNKVFPFARARKQMAPYLRDIHDFFRITQQLETALTIAQIWPVRVLDVIRSSDETEIEVTPVEEPERNELAQHLSLDRPSHQMRDWVHLGAEPVVADDEDEPKRDSYRLLDRRNVDSDGSNAEWHFASARPSPDGPRYRFRCALGAAPAHHGQAYLARNHDGTLAQIRRRHRAIEELRLQESVLRLLADPRAVSRSSNDKLPEPRTRIDLDKSKLRALARLWKLQPSFAIQGPPGTGKTTLIKGFADRLFSADPSAQVVITAHSHHTVDDVRRKLAGMLSQYTGRVPVIVRLGAKKPTKHDIEPVTRTLLRRLQQSRMVKDAPGYLRDRIEALAPIAGPRDEAAEVELRTMQLLVQDAANLTFATCNAAELAELASRGRRFDWSVIEEAGKAHGFDMAVALQESHRLLLIGDHRQLPPFNAALYKKLLGNPLRVKKAIETGAQFAPGLIDPSIVDEDDDRESLSDRCARWRQMVTLFGVLFDKSASEGGAEDGPAATLTEQHRMHPDIANLVGMIFYPAESGGTFLVSPKETREKFEKAPPFNVVSAAWLPEQRVIWYDVPWVQKQEYAEGETEGLFASPAEANGVVDILEQFRPADGEDCSIQILSPYNDQLKLIRERIDAARREGRLENMFRDPFDLRSGKRLGATVDEFQGGEADIVIVSLVRNNALVPWKSIGFLKEANRMNVLLSRARHKLIVVGSWDFWSTRCNSLTPPDAEYSYIARMMALMTASEKTSQVAVVRGRQ